MEMVPKKPIDVNSRNYCSMILHVTITYTLVVPAKFVNFISHREQKVDVISFVHAI